MVDTDPELTSVQVDDLVEGALKGAILYLRMADWAMNPHSLARMLDRTVLPAVSEVLKPAEARMPELASVDLADVDRG